MSGRRCALLAIAAAQVAASLAVPAAARAATLEEYRARVSEAHALARAALPEAEHEVTVQTLGGRLTSLVPGTEEVLAGDAVITVDNGTLSSLVVSMESAKTPLERERGVHDVERYLGTLDRSLGVPGAMPRQDPAALASLLERPGQPSTSAFGRWFSRMVDAVSSWLGERLAALRPGGSPVARGVLAVVTAMLVTALGWALLGVWRAARDARAAEQRLALAASAAVVPEAEELPEDALGFADGLAARGEARLAVRALFGGAARALASGGLVPPTRFRTNGELLASASRSLPAVRTAFGDLIERFERAWYGHSEPGTEGYEAARERYEQIEALAARVLAEGGRDAAA